jgi:hypothetical protein
MKLKVFFVIFLILILPIVNAVTVVQVDTPPAEEEKGNFLSNTFSFLKEPVFWYVVIGLIILTLFFVVMFFIIRWLIKFLKSQNDIFYLLKNDRIKMAKIQRRYDSKHWWKIKKNAPIRLVKKEGDKLIISRPIAYHRGDYTTNEGNVTIAMNLEGKNKYFFFPETDLMIIPNREKVEVEQLNKKGEKEIIQIANLPRSKDIVQFNENEILIFAESLSKVGQFIIPVIKSKDGKVIDLALPTFASLKEVVLGDYLYVQTDEFGKLAKQSMNINPNVRAITKVGDQNSNVEMTGVDGNQ